MHSAIMQLQPPPDHRGGSGLAVVRQGGPALPGAVHADARIEVIGRLPGLMPGPGQPLIAVLGIYPQMRLVAGPPGSRRTSTEPREAACHQMQSWY